MALYCAAVTGSSFRFPPHFNFVTRWFPWPHAPSTPPLLPALPPFFRPFIHTVPLPLACPHNSLFQPSLPWIIQASALLVHIDHPIPSTPTSLYLQLFPPTSTSLLIALTVLLPLATAVTISLFRLPKEATGKLPSINQAEYDNTLLTRMFCHQRVLTPNLVSQWRMLRLWVGRKA